MYVSNILENHLQCVHVANGSSRHYGICYSFLELPVMKKHIFFFIKKNLPAVPSLQFKCKYCFVYCTRKCFCFQPNAMFREKIANLLWDFPERGRKNINDFPRLIPPVKNIICNTAKVMSTRLLLNTNCFKCLFFRQKS